MHFHIGQWHCNFDPLVHDEVVSFHFRSHDCTNISVFEASSLTAAHITTLFRPSVLTTASTSSKPHNVGPLGPEVEFSFHGYVCDCVLVRVIETHVQPSTFVVGAREEQYDGFV